MADISMKLEGADALIRKLAETGKDISGKLRIAAHAIAAVLEGYAKSHHLWKDRTGNLNNSTHGTVEEFSEDAIVIALGEGLEDYGVYLELAHQERYAWLRPAVEENKARIMEILRHYLGVS